MLGIIALVVKSKKTTASAAVILPPVRTCIACKQSDSRSRLVRLVSSIAADGNPEVVVDWQSRLPGRGAWLHPSQDCLKLALKRKAITRALPGARGVAQAEAELAERFDQAVTI